MLQVNAAMWNQIAEVGPLRTPIGRLFLLNQEQQNQAHQLEAERLEAEGVDPDVVLAYLEVAPLLAERKAIARYKDLHPAKFDYLNQALPEVNTVQSAVLLSTREHRLTIGQQKQLSVLLTNLNNLETSEPASELHSQSQ